MFNIACRSGTKRARKENAEIVKMESLKRFSVRIMREPQIYKMTL